MCINITTRVRRIFEERNEGREFAKQSRGHGLNLKRRGGKRGSDRWRKIASRFFIHDTTDDGRGIHPGKLPRMLTITTDPGPTEDSTISSFCIFYEQDNIFHQKPE